MNVQAYLDILDFPGDASWLEIEARYEKKLPEIHAKAGNSEDDMNELLALHLAFEYLIGFKLHKIYEPETHQFRDMSKKEWNHWDDVFYERSDEIQERIRAYSQMELKAFQASDYYTQAIALFTKEDLPNYRKVSLITLGLPVLGLLTLGYAGLAIAMAVITACNHYLKEELHKLYAARLNSRQQGFTWFVNSGTWTLMLLTGNILVFLFVTARTFIPTNLLTILFAGAFVVGMLPPWHLITRLRFLRRHHVAFGLLPAWFNLFFALNFIFATPLMEETLYFSREWRPTSGHGYSGPSTTTTVLFDYEVYEQYYHIRYFSDYDEMEATDVVRFDIYQGPFGLRVLNSWEFGY